MRGPLLFVLACALLVPSVLGSPMMLRDGATQEIDGLTLELLIVGNSDEPEALFLANGEPLPALGEHEEAALPGGGHIYVKDIMVNDRDGLVIYTLW